MPTARLLVPRLRSADDEARLEAALRAVTGVYGVVANRRSHCVEVDFEDDMARLNDIVNAATGAGFDARFAG
jgi:hypothetical protein